MKTRRLLALDLDGTLVKNDGTIAPHDVAAIGRARSAGVIVTIVTGRIAAAALGVAREIEIDVPIVCADGAQLIEPTSGALLEHASVSREATSTALSVFAARELVAFALTHEAVHACRGAEALTPWVRGFSPEIRLHAAWPEELDAVAMLLGLGAREPADRAAEELGSLSLSDADSFSIGDLRAVRVRSIHSTKGRALSALAARLDVDRSNVAFAGDWYNDVSAFEWAGRSFCMGQAPPDVRARAHEVLRATSADGGGVAEVVSRWL